MLAHQAALIDVLLDYEAVRFGDFTLKSGRRSPYFVNLGQLRTGNAVARLGRAFAAHLDHHECRCDLVFGPSYKGVPLAVATTMALADRGRDVAFAFDRKEAKDHGEGGTFVGATPTSGMRVVVVDDVITSGRSIRDAVELLRRQAELEIAAVVVAVDRQERGRSELTTKAELERELGVRVLPVVTIRALVEHLHGHVRDGAPLVTDGLRAAVLDHLAEHGGQDPR